MAASAVMDHAQANCLEADPNITMDASHKSLLESDDISIGSSVHEIITLETNRKKERKQKSRERIRKLFKQTFSLSKNTPGTTTLNSPSTYDNLSVDNDLSLSSADTISDLNTRSRKVTKPLSIMTVRTQEESVGGGGVSNMRKLRRKVTIRMKSDISCASNRSRSVADDENLSEASASTNSLDDISLSFSRVEIREYEVVPGVNPSVSEGPPIELGWGHTDARAIGIDQYEGTRLNYRRLKLEMRMPSKVRTNLLLDHGSTKKMIREATKIAKKHRWW